MPWRHLCVIVRGVLEAVDAGAVHESDRYDEVKTICARAGFEYRYAPIDAAFQAVEVARKKQRGDWRPWPNARRAVRAWRL